MSETNNKSESTMSPLAESLVSVQEVEGEPQKVEEGSTSSVSSSVNSNAKLEAKRSLRNIMVSCIDSALEELGAIEAREAAIAVTVTPPELTNTAPAETATPSTVDLGYGRASPVLATTAAAVDLGYGRASPDETSPSPKICPELQQQFRGCGRRPRYHRRNSVTKFSLENVLKQVQKEDREDGVLHSHSHDDNADLVSAANTTKISPHRHLFERLYSTKLEVPPMVMKRTALSLCHHPHPLTVAAARATTPGLVSEGRAAKRRRGVL